MRKGGKLLGSALIGVGLLLMAAALFLTTRFQREAQEAGDSAAAVADALEAVISESLDANLGQLSPVLSLEQEYAAQMQIYPEMPTTQIDNYSYIGLISVPSQGIELPVMDIWDYTRLKVAPCRYSGSYFSNDLVICGHNYPHHFSPLKSVEVGADVYFTTVDGQIYHYTVIELETLKRYDVDILIDNSTGWDLTLFTCHNGGGTRCVVRCARVEE